MHCEICKNISRNLDDLDNLTTEQMLAMLKTIKALTGGEDTDTTEG